MRRDSFQIHERGDGYVFRKVRKNGGPVNVRVRGRYESVAGALSHTTPPDSSGGARADESEGVLDVYKSQSCGYPLSQRQFLPSYLVAVEQQHGQ